MVTQVSQKVVMAAEKIRTEPEQEREQAEHVASFFAKEGQTEERDALPTMSSLKDSVDEEEFVVVEDTKEVRPAFTQGQLHQLVAIIDSAMDRGAKSARALQIAMEDRLQTSLSTVSSFALSTTFAKSSDPSDE